MSKKKKLLENLTDAALELVIAAVCFGIGALILHLSGSGVWQTDPELVVLIGVGIVIVVTLAAYFAIKRIKKMRIGAASKDKECSNDNETD